MQPPLHIVCCGTDSGVSTHSGHSAMRCSTQEKTRAASLCPAMCGPRFQVAWRAKGAPPLLLVPPHAHSAPPHAHSAPPRAYSAPPIRAGAPGGRGAASAVIAITAHEKARHEIHCDEQAQLTQSPRAWSVPLQLLQHTRPVRRMTMCTSQGHPC